MVIAIVVTWVANCWRSGRRGHGAAKARRVLPPDEPADPSGVRSLSS
jgi:hypothetical protein